MNKDVHSTSSEQIRALSLSTLAFVVCFAVWTIFSIIGIKIKQELSLNETQFGLLVAMPILSGSLSRLFLGMITDRFGGRIIFSLVMLLSAISTWFLASAHTYTMYLVAALGIGLAGGSFAVGIAYVSHWFPQKKQGTALGIFGLGNVGAAITNFVAPFLLIAYGWQGVARIYAVILGITAILFWIFSKENPVIIKRRKEKLPPPSIAGQLKPFGKTQVWRFSFYYFFVFGAFVALALWLPQYYISVYGMDIKMAGILSASYALPGSVFRALGGWLSDKIGARRVMYWTFTASLICLFVLSYPETEYVVHGIHKTIQFSFDIPLLPFVMITVVLGIFMSLGSAAVYKHIANYYPDNVGSVGGIVGLVGGLGGFVLPILFGIANDHIHVWTSCFMMLWLVVAIMFIWMHFSVLDLIHHKNPTEKLNL